MLRSAVPLQIALAMTVASTCVTAASAGEMSPFRPLTASAKWIWRAQADGPVYNQTIIARKTVRLDAPRQATVRITADSFYRLYVNGQWVNDGPGRAWPEHYQYDVLDVSHYLRDGENQLEIVARYYGVGDFHRVPQHPGLLAEMEVASASGAKTAVVTDATWDVAEAAAWIANTPKVSVQMEPCELYDARLADKLQFAKARELFTDGKPAPWKDLHPRDSALLSREPVAFQSFAGAKLVKCEGLDFCLPAVRLMHPGLIEANHNTSAPCGMATIIESDRGGTFELQLEGMKLAIDGRMQPQGLVHVERGRHLALAFVQTVAGHDKEKAVRLLAPIGVKLVNPLNPHQANPWVFLPLPEFDFVDNDLIWIWFAKENAKVRPRIEAYVAETNRLMRDVRSPADFTAKLAAKARQLPADAMFVRDANWQFVHRAVMGDAASLVRSPAAALHDTPAVTTIEPSQDGDVELLYDLGRQDCGYYTFDMLAPAGTTVDIFAVEYITPDGKIQFARGNRNGLRYITREGVNRFTSLKRRSGRYVFLTLRNQKGPVALRHFGLIESTYPVNAVGSFACSDARLDKIWEISTHTLKLCMEDTFTDCPLYEQTHWVGDARNESLLAYPVFGATDLGRHCIRVTAQSLEHYPIAGCQTPSCWDTLLPAWSFLWGISSWDYYWYTGDRDFVREIYPAVIRNLKGAEKYVTDRGLFAAPFWNMFDWTPIDQQHKAVLHNTMFMIGAIDAAAREARLLDNRADEQWLGGLRLRLRAGVNRLWNAEKKSYPDSVHDDGTTSASTSQHTSFLSILYDILDPAHRPAAQQNLLNPPEKMVRIGSPFAVLYLYEAYEKLGLDGRIIEDIYRNYLPMLESGATTVWESFPTGTTGSGGFPTRSHCHAWSSAPSYFLNRIVVGLKPTAPGGSQFQLSPQLSGLTWARGTVATIRGPISVFWRLKDGKTLDVVYTKPAGIEVKFARNPSLEGRDVVVNGTQQ